MTETFYRRPLPDSAIAFSSAEGRRLFAEALAGRRARRVLPPRRAVSQLLDGCVPLEIVRTRGLDLDELACLARCNGADVTLHRADSTLLETWRSALREGAKADAVIVASYDRSALGQTGTGHFSPLGGYHLERDLTLILELDLAAVIRK